ncbi:MAG: class I SAM-dependent methyltransferase [Thermodesulfobacteriota bacterium]
MRVKGNKVENWNESYERLKVTYSERKDTPVELMNLIQWEFVKEDIDRYLGNPSKAKVLECGCGGARTSLYLARNGFDVTCSDNAPEAIRLAEDNFNAYGARGTFLQDDLLDSKLPADSFDCVMSFGLLEHFEELRPVVASITRLTKPGGIQIHCVITKKFSLLTLMNVLLYPLRFANNLAHGRLKRIFIASYRDFPHFENTFTAEEYCREFERGGNTVLRCEAGGFLFPVLTLPIVGSLLTKAFHETLYRTIRRTDRTESKIGHILAPTFYVVCRKR